MPHDVKSQIIQWYHITRRPRAEGSELLQQGYYSERQFLTWFTGSLAGHGAQGSVLTTMKASSTSADSHLEEGKSPAGLTLFTHSPSHAF